MIYSNGIDGSFLSALFQNTNTSKGTLTRYFWHDYALFSVIIINQFEGDAGESVTQSCYTSGASAITWEGSSQTLTAATPVQRAVNNKLMLR